MLKSVVLLGITLAVTNAATTTTTKPSFPCICTMEYMPVCGKDGVTYGNKCGMNCAGVELDHVGACGQACICPRNFQPVCGSDGKTYSNKCLLKCSGAVLAYEGNCNAVQQGDEPLCVCPFIYLPVCGDDGVTYGNQCALDCSNSVKKVSDGQCPKAAVNMTLAPTNP